MYETILPGILFFNITVIIGLVMRHIKLNIIINDNSIMKDKIELQIKENNLKLEKVKLLKSENYHLNEVIHNLNNEIVDIVNKNLKLEDNERYYKNIINGKKKFIEEDFGSGTIRIFENGVYYHGVCEEEKQTWNKDNQCSRYIYEYNTKSKNKTNLDTYNTFNIDDFCNNCLLMKVKKKYKIFKCQGHQY